MRSQFDAQLVLLNQKMLELSSLVEKAIDDSFSSLDNQDTVLAEQVIEKDAQINAKETEIETMCLNLLLQQQPVAKDFRTITAVLKSITDLERIGDYAVNISETAINLSKQKYITEFTYLPEMTKITKIMVRDSIKSYIERDLDLARKVMEQDDEVDALLEIIRTKLINLIHDEKSNGEQAMELYLVARFLERVGDHATNIAEWVEFMLTGVHAPE